MNSYLILSTFGFTGISFYGLPSTQGLPPLEEEQESELSPHQKMDISVQFLHMIVFNCSRLKTNVLPVLKAARPCGS